MGHSGSCGAAVYAHGDNGGGNAFITMKGGTITGNNSTFSDNTNRTTGGIFLGKCSFVMEGGSINGNGSGCFDLYSSDVGIVTLSGNAAIGEFTMGAVSSARSHTAIASGWTGSVDILNLRLNNSTPTNIVNYWLQTVTPPDPPPVQVIESAVGYTITLADVGRITRLGRFLGLSGASQNMTGNPSPGPPDNYRISTTPATIGELELDP